MKMGNQITLPDGSLLTLYSGEAKQVGDGNHTFEELYEHRILLFLAFLKNVSKDLKWKSLRHNDGSPMYENSFICGCNLPDTGKQISYHLPLRYFDLCNCPTLQVAPPWDRHTSFDVLDRLADYVFLDPPKMSGNPSDFGKDSDFDLFFQKDRNPQTWVGFDFDGTLAYYSKEEAVDASGKHDNLWLGKPIPLTLDCLKKWLDIGVEVRILTARVSSLPFLEKPTEEQQVVLKIQDWCLQYLGRILPVTCIKDKDMFCLYDDRVIQLLKNTGLRRT